MRAQASLGREQQLVLWSSPLVILEAGAGSDPQEPSEDLEQKFKSMMREMARVFASPGAASNRQCTFRSHLPGICLK
jgi:hypothetical protein